MGSWYSNPGTGATESMPGDGGVGKYLKARNSKSDEVSAINDLESIPITKKMKTAIPNVEYKNFSAW